MCYFEVYIDKLGMKPQLECSMATPSDIEKLHIQLANMCTVSKAKCAILRLSIVPCYMQQKSNLFTKHVMLYIVFFIILYLVLFIYSKMWHFEVPNCTF